MGGGTILKVAGGTSARQKSMENFCGLNWHLWCHKHWKWRHLLLSACLSNFMKCFINPQLPLSTLHLRCT